MSVPHEDTVNICLAELLNETLGSSAIVIPEEPTKRRGKFRRFDIRIEFKGIEFILEASYNPTDAEKDAIKRLEEGLIDTVTIAVHYEPKLFKNRMTPSKIKEALDSNPLKLKVYTLGRDISETLVEFISNTNETVVHSIDGWIYIPISDFGSFLDTIVEHIVREDILHDLVQQVEEKVNYFVEVVLNELKHPKAKKRFLSDLNKILFSPSQKEEISLPDVPDEVLVSQAYISLLMASILYESVCQNHGLNSLQRLLMKNANHPLLAMKEGFEDILKINYEAVFDIALGITTIFFDLQSSQGVMDALSDMINYASKVVRNKALLRQDFIGHIYHRVTGDIATRKGYATFYTKSPIATFLANLAMITPNDSWNLDWGNVDEIKQFKVCDFACGSGTLLSAVYGALLSQYRKRALESGTLDLNEFHKAVIENSVWGFDALEHAVQAASVVLSLHEPGVPLNRINVYHVSINESGALGSLDLWDTNQPLVPLKRRSIDNVVIESVIVPKFDLIIMNPPFARSTAPGKEGSRPRIFDFVVDLKTYQKLWTRYKDLIDKIKKENLKKKTFEKIYNNYVGKDKVFTEQNVNPINAGASLPFIFLADRYLKVGGRLALVLPKTVIESSAFFLARVLMLSGYDIEYIVISEEEGNYNFSYSTQLSEILMVLRKIKNNDNIQNHKDTQIIKFRRQPRSNLEGLLVAKEVIDLRKNKSENKKKNTISEFIKVLGSEAEVYSVNRKVLEDFVWNWSILIDLHPVLVKFISELVNGKIFDVDVNIIKLSDLGDSLKITNPRKFRGANLGKYFTKSTKGQFRILSRAGKDVMCKLSMDLTNTENITPSNAESINVFEKCSGRIVIPESIRFNTIPLLAIYSDILVISSVAFVSTFDNYVLDKSLITWLNSTYSIAYLRPLVSSIEGVFGHLRGWHLKILLIPDIKNTKIAKGLSNIFEKYKDVKWPSLPVQYENAINGNDDLRLRFDLDILKAITPNEINTKKVKNELINIYIKLLNVLR